MGVAFRSVRIFAAVVAVAVCTGPLRLSARQTSNPDELYRNHQWFDLREAMAGVAVVPALYRAALACEFHDVAQCEKTVKDALAASPSPDQEYELREFLNNFYFRAGRYRAALAELNRMAAIRPNAADLANALPLLQALSRRDDQTTAARAPSSIAARRSNQNFPLSLTINGRTARYFFDTGANLSVMTESEAKRLGLTVFKVSTRVSNTAGAAIEMQVATADTLVAGRVKLRNVAFLIFRDDQEPFSELPTGGRGAIGLPVLLAFGTFSWGADNQFVIGTPASRPGPSNLGFDGGLPIVRASIDGKALAFNLDTGAEETMLWPPFAQAFVDLVERSGTRATTNVSGVGSSVDAASIDLARLDLVLGGRPVTLAPASVLLQSTTADTRRRFGNVGLDLLNQARRTTISFESMTLTLDAAR